MTFLLKNLNRNKIWKNGMPAMIGVILIRAMDLISIPVFTRLLNTAEYGQVSVFMTLVQMMIIITSLDFAACASRGTLDFKEQRNRFYSVTLFFTVLWTGCLTMLANLLYGVIGPLVSMSRAEINILIMYSFATFVINYKSAEYIFFMEYRKNTAMSMALAFGNLGLSVCFINTFFSRDRFFGRILGAAIPAVLIAAVLVTRYIRDGKCLWNRDYISYALRFCVPLIPHNLSHMILSSSDRIMIRDMAGNSASGIYSLTYMLGMVLQVVTEGANNAWIPLLFRRLDGNERRVVRSQARVYLTGYTMAAVAVIAISPEIIKLLAVREYWEGIDLVMWICFAVYLIFVYQLFVNVEFYHKKTAWISAGTMIAAAVNIGLNLYGIPVYGYGFAAVSTVISYALLVIFHCMILNLVIGDRVMDNGFILLLTAGMAGAVFLLHVMRYRLGLRLFAMLLLELVLALVLFREWKRKENQTI